LNNNIGQRIKPGFKIGSKSVGLFFLDVLLSIYLLTKLNTAAVWLLGVLLGIQLICEWLALSSLAWQVRRSRPKCAPKSAMKTQH
jgi:uncharacterized membrane protein HdeD (DUF308 family)